MVSTDPIADIFIHAERKTAGTSLNTAFEVSKQPSASGNNNEHIAKVAREFEAVFLSQMLQAMAPEESDENSLFGGKESDAIFRTMMMEEYAKEIAKAGGIGLASHIERELLGTQHTQVTQKHIPAQWQGLIDNYKAGVNNNAVNDDNKISTQH